MASKSAASEDDVSQQSSGSGGRKVAAAAAEQQALKCPRCDSPNTKFCYYNNYSLSQPRHFCKTCRRYWTRGGALRSVPIGGGCRKNKKMKSSSSSSSSSVSTTASRLSAAIDSGGGTSFFNTFSPAVDFQLGGLNFPAATASATSAATALFNHFSAATAASPVIIPQNPCFVNTLDPAPVGPPGAGTSLLGFNFSFPSLLKRQGENGQIAPPPPPGFQEINSNNFNSLQHDQNNNNITSSIESLSSINQELHWKLQQQRLAMLFGADNPQHRDQQQQQKDDIINSDNNLVSAVIQGNNQMNNNCIHQKPQPILFQNLEISKTGSNEGEECGGHNGNLATEWLFDNSAGFADHANAAAADGNGFQAWSNNNNHYNY